MGMDRGYVLQVILIALIAGSFADEHFLPAPDNISMVSINMKHFLYWDPVMVAGHVTYSVQSQGEYETLYMADFWHKALNCQEISTHQCNVTDEVQANVLYKFRVQSILGNQTSAWAELDPPFNRRTTLLIPPKIDLQVSGLSLIADIEDYGSSFKYFVFYWQKGKKDGMKVRKAESVNTFLETAEEGKEYCAEVIAYASAINKSSSSSDSDCVQVEEKKHSALFIGLLCAFGVVLVIVPIVFGGWKAATMVRHFCCPDEEIPDVLNDPYISERILKNGDSSEKDNSEEIYSVELNENSSHTAKLQRL